MEVVYECCCGLDVHAKTVVACLITRGRKEIRTFATMMDELLQLGDWLSSVGCTHVAIESTGVYWKSHEGTPHRRRMKKGCAKVEAAALRAKVATGTGAPSSLGR